MTFLKSVKQVLPHFDTCRKGVFKWGSLITKSAEYARERMQYCTCHRPEFCSSLPLLKGNMVWSLFQSLQTVFKLVQKRMCEMGTALFLLCVCVCTWLWNIWFLKIITSIKLNLSASIHTLQAWGYWSLATENKSLKVLQKPYSGVAFIS